MAIEGLTVFFGWALVINIGILLFSTVLLILLRDFISRIHAQMFSLDEKEVGKTYFQ